MITPTYKVVANDSDITRAIAQRLKHLRLTDESDTETSDSLEIVLADHDETAPLEIPETGAELRVSIGYVESGLVDKGLFIVDEVELSGAPNEMRIVARAAVLEKSKGGKSAMQSHKSRSWKKGTTLGAMVKKIASEHGLRANITPKLSAVALPQVSQSSESDLNLLQRMARKFDAVAKVAGGVLLFVRRGEASSASGGALPVTTVKLSDASSWRVNIAKREAAGCVVAYYRNAKEAKRYEVKVGTGEPVQRIRRQFADEASARAAAEARAQRNARAEKTLSLRLPGRPEVAAEAPVRLSGFRAGVPVEWIATRVEHYIGPDGYSTTVDGELPNSATKVGAAQKAEQTAAEMA